MKKGDLVRHTNGKEGIFVEHRGNTGYATVRLADGNGPRVRVDTDKLTLVKTAEQLEKEHDELMAKSRVESLAYAKANFAVNVQITHYSGDMVIVSVTHNDNQWSSLGVYPEELAKVRDAIDAYIRENPCGS